ncbi:HPP family protein [Anaerosporobacter faecicola]|uniref:HPP family protein n=1 Tax=Anaerosporobacter faecicola TaxID=2718714 RepID=UPI00143BE0E4|nr:HPP family protein [Anaerosporobacter faecicola]
MAIIIVGVQWWFEKKSYVERVIYQPVERRNKESVLYYGKRIVIFLILACIPILFGKLYIVAPPLIVTFMEFSNEKAKIRGKYREVMILMVTASILGTCSRLVLHEQMRLSLTFCTFVIISCMLVAFTVIRVSFPPAGAISMLPLILKVPGLRYYPVYVGIGSAVLIFAACFCFKEKDIEAKDIKEMGIKSIEC